MDLFKSQFDRIQRQLAGLSASQKMLTATLVAIMVMTLMMWGRYAGEAEMVTLLDQTLAEEDVSRILGELDARRIEHRTSGGRITVPADRKMEAVALLGYAQVLPRNFVTAFDEMAKQITPWATAGQNEALWKRAKETALSQLISHFPNVKNAFVLVDGTTTRRIGSDVRPSATITIFMQSGTEASQKLVNAAADVVTGAQAGLDRSQIKITVDGEPRKVQGAHEGGGLGSDEQLALLEQHERRLEEKIGKHLQYIPNLVVSVAVDVDTTAKKAQNHTYHNDPDKIIHKPVEESEKSFENNGGGAGGEPGVVPNVGTNTEMDINNPGGVAAAGGGTSSTESETKTKFELKASETVETISTPAGDATPVSASVRVPRSYFVNVLKAGKPDAKDPDDTAVQALIKQEMPKIREAVLACAAFKSKEAVTVDTYLDALPLQLAAASEPPSAPMASLVGGNAKEIALGALAVVSLFMVSMMVRKSGPAPVAAGAALAMAGTPSASASGSSTGPRRPGLLGTGEALVGEAGANNPLLDGMELDEDAIKTQQMLDQVSTLVADNPDAAATLVRRWMSRA